MSPPAPVVWGSWNDFYLPNVVGTTNVIDACLNAASPIGFHQFPQCRFDGHDENGIDESAPYPARYLAHYPRTKALAEQRVLHANSRELATIALRPISSGAPAIRTWSRAIISRAQSRQTPHRRHRPEPRRFHLHRQRRPPLTFWPPIASPPPAPAPARPTSSANGQPIPWPTSSTASSPPPACPRHPHLSARFAYALGAILEATHKFLRLKSEPP